MDLFYQVNQTINNIIWGVPMLVLLVGCGLYLTIRTRFLAFRKFPFILKQTAGSIFSKGENKGEGEVTSFQALSTALAATVGTGNIVGVAGAIILGGPGAVFWMWLAATFGMTTKMAEATLAVAYRDYNNGNVRGGPMYYISRGLQLPWLGKIFAFFGMLACLGIGNTVQSNAITNILNANFHIPKLPTAIVITVITFIVIIGGIKRIGAFTEKLVPLMAGLYILGALVIIISRASYVPAAFGMIFKGAFSTTAAAGGIGGYTLRMAMQNGVARGVFTNEAGLGSSPIAHAAATTDHPARQGLWGVFEVFIDTICICTMTALVILTTGVWEGHGDASSLVAFSFEEGFTGGKYIVTIGLVLFALSTILGWEYYGESCARFLLGDRVGNAYKFFFVPIVLVGGLIPLDAVWAVADNLNGLMAIPNLIGLIGLSSIFIRLQRNYFTHNPEHHFEKEDWMPLLKKYAKEKSAS